jgi:hypothetical protein
VAQSHTPCNRCVRFATAVARGHATLATKRTLLLTWAGLAPAGSHQLLLAHFGRLHTLEDSARVGAYQAICIGQAASVAHGSARPNVFGPQVECGHHVAAGKCNELIAPAVEESIGATKECPAPSCARVTNAESISRSVPAFRRWTFCPSLRAAACKAQANRFGGPAKAAPVPLAVLRYGRVDRSFCASAGLSASSSRPGTGIRIDIDAAPVFYPIGIGVWWLVMLWGAVRCAEPWACRERRAEPCS